MFTSLFKLHKFLASQSFYPLVLSTLVSLGVFVVRTLYFGRRLEMGMLVWNLFLAWIPYGCSLTAALLEHWFPRKGWILLLPGALWLAFFPNAPYIVTDFYHLGWSVGVPLWFDIGLIATFAFSGCFLAIASLRTMHLLVRSYFGRIAGWLFALVSIGLGGLGVYLGRFGRYNSWDLLIQPKQVFKDIALMMLNPLDNLGFVGFTLMFTAILLVFYLMFVSGQQAENAFERSSNPKMN